VSSTKSELRNAIRSRLAALDNTTWIRASDAVTRHLLALGERNAWRSWLAFMPMDLAQGDEVDLSQLVRALLEENPGRHAPAHTKRVVCLPRTDWATKSLTPVPVQNLSTDIEVARYSLREPKADLLPLALGDLDVVIVPGLAFDSTGARLGRGGGFYDRLLARLATLPAKNRPVSVGVCLDEQLVEIVPVEAHDLRVDMMVTPSKVLHTPRGSR
jgi:5-formyltetrahydrofolate cyclo-ligase